MKEVDYADVFSFLYSSRPETAAAKLSDTLTKAVKQERFDRLIALQTETSARIWASDQGKVLPVLVEGESRQGAGQLFGRTTWNRVITSYSIHYTKLYDRNKPVFH